MKRVLFLAFAIFSTFYDSAANEKAVWKITPFTGMDYVRIVVDERYRETTGNSFKVTIKAIEGGKVLWEGPVTAEPAINSGPKQLAFTVKNLKPTLWTPTNPHL